VSVPVIVHLGDDPSGLIRLPLSAMHDGAGLDRCFQGGDVAPHAQLQCCRKARKQISAGGRDRIQKGNHDLVRGVAFEPSLEVEPAFDFLLADRSQAG
jgi:hypothetical protein